MISIDEASSPYNRGTYDANVDSMRTIELEPVKAYFAIDDGKCREGGLSFKFHAKGGLCHLEPKDVKKLIEDQLCDAKAKISRKKIEHIATGTISLIRDMYQLEEVTSSRIRINTSIGGLSSAKKYKEAQFTISAAKANKPLLALSKDDIKKQIKAQIREHHGSMSVRRLENMAKALYHKIRAESEDARDIVTELEERGLTVQVTGKKNGQSGTRAFELSGVTLEEALWFSDKQLQKMVHGDVTANGEGLTFKKEDVRQAAQALSAKLDVYRRWYGLEQGRVVLSPDGESMVKLTAPSPSYSPGAMLPRFFGAQERGATMDDVDGVPAVPSSHTPSYHPVKFNVGQAASKIAQEKIAQERNPRIETLRKRLWPLVEISKEKALASGYCGQAIIEPKALQAHISGTDFVGLGERHNFSHNYAFGPAVVDAVKQAGKNPVVLFETHGSSGLSDEKKDAQISWLNDTAKQLMEDKSMSAADKALWMTYFESYFDAQTTNNPDHLDVWLKEVAVSESRSLDAFFEHMERSSSGASKAPVSSSAMSNAPAGNSGPLSPRSRMNMNQISWERFNLLENCFEKGVPLEYISQSGMHRNMPDVLHKHINQRNYPILFCGSGHLVFSKDSSKVSIASGKDLGSESGNRKALKIPASSLNLAQAFNGFSILSEADLKEIARTRSKAGSSDDANQIPKNFVGRAIGAYAAQSLTGGSRGKAAEPIQVSTRIFAVRTQEHHDALDQTLVN